MNIFLVLSLLVGMSQVQAEPFPKVLFLKEGKASNKRDCHITVTDIGVPRTGEELYLTTRFIEQNNNEKFPFSFTELTKEYYDKLLNSKNDERFVYDRFQGENSDGSAVLYTIENQSGVKRVKVRPLDVEKYRQNIFSSYDLEIVFKDNQMKSFHLMYYRRLRFTNIYVKSFDEVCELK